MVTLSFAARPGGRAARATVVSWGAMTLPPDNRILGVDMYRATALSMVLWLGLLEATEACGEDECNWTQPLHYFEQLSGLFFLLGGLVGALSACRSLERGAPRRSLLVTAAVRGAVLAATGYAARAFDIVFTKRVFAPLAVRAPLRLPSAAHLWRDAVDALRDAARSEQAPAAQLSIGRTAAHADAPV